MENNYDKDEIIKIILNSSQERIIEQLGAFHPVDILDGLRGFQGDIAAILRKLPVEIVADIIDQAEDEEKYELLRLLPDETQKKIINEISSDELVDLIKAVPGGNAVQILSKVDSEDIEEIKELMTYPPDTAGGLMTPDFFCIKESMTIEEILASLRSIVSEAETSYYLYVLDDQDRLTGVVSLRDIVVNNFNVKASEIMNRNVISVPFDMDQEEVGRIFNKYGFLIVPVLNSDGKMLGIITVDDIFEVLQEENTEDILRLGGLPEGEEIAGGVRDSVKRRLPWLYVNLVTALLASATVGLFEGTIQRVVTLATFMPIVAGMGGNTGTQTLTIIVRGIALGELTFENAKKVLIKEVGVGLITGLFIGITVAVLGYIWEKNPMFGLVAGLAMLLNMAMATFSGYVIPVALKKLKIDPALASAVFVTTVTDVVGFFLFLGLATLFIQYLT